MANRHPVAQYMRGVLDGSVPACQLIKQAVQRHLDDLEHGADRGLHFDRTAAVRAIQFFNFLRHYEGEWAGHPFGLEPWQQFILWVLFGWKNADGTRRYKTSYIEIPRKNGKSTFAAGVGLYMLIGDGEPGAQVYAAATKRDQARIVHKTATQMVKASPDLLGMVRIFKDNLNVPATVSKFEPLGADRDGMDGLNIHCSVIDELHAHRTSGVVDVLSSALGARRQPLIFEITTAGFNQASICWEHHEYTRRILSGSLQDDAWFGFIATINEGDDWHDEAAWAKANPNLGVSVKLDFLRDEHTRAAQMPVYQNTFKRMYLNVWTQQSDRWIDLDLWDANGGEPMEQEEIEALFVGRTCYGGLDLSSVSDLIAWVMVAFDEDDPDKVDILARLWCPEAQLANEHNKYREQYQAWHEAGWLLTTPGDAADYKAVRRQIVADAERYHLIDLNIDRLFQGYGLSVELEEDEGLTVFGMGQGFYAMAAPMKDFERLLLSKALRHHGNAVLRWMADNMTVKQDPAGNLKPDKSESQGKIDGIVALVMALDRAVRNQGEGAGYEDDEFMVLG